MSGGISYSIFDILLMPSNYIASLVWPRSPSFLGIHFAIRNEVQVNTIQALIPITSSQSFLITKVLGKTGNA